MSAIRRIVCLQPLQIGNVKKIATTIPQDYLIALPRQFRPLNIARFCGDMCISNDFCICKHGDRFCTILDSNHPMSAFRITHYIHSYKVLVKNVLVDFQGDMERDPYMYQAVTYIVKD
jgi:hypothetical protein